ncbi:MAG: exodeoxyribonuclease V subunit alpha [Rhodocyclaceae bacterium]|nr:exodeoxyribonuclease V subunit alpha [Rhodocyclaceae bacterium]
MSEPQPSIVGHFARALGGGERDAELAAALACAAVQMGHVCADLGEGIGWAPWREEWTDAARKRFLERLPRLSIVGGAQDATPLVWDGARLYLRRYFDYERTIATELCARSALVSALGAESSAELAAAFQDAGQRRAAEIALTRHCAMISGGPGTGKTYTLARIIQALRRQTPHLRIALAAPTGKAATRMAEALRAAGAELLPQNAQTLHRLLGADRDGRRFRYGREQPLPVDFLAVDEASMIDVAMMARLLLALPRKARLLLLGDRDQLAAVEAGAVFAELCEHPRLAENVAILATQFRFGPDSGIARLAQALRMGDLTRASMLFESGAEDLVWHQRRDWSAVIGAARAGFAAYRAAVAAGQRPEELFFQLSAFRVLCAHREDAQAVNRALSEGEHGKPEHGTPLIVTKNDAWLRVFNGDIGIVWERDGVREALFAGEQGLRSLPLSRLPAWEPAWAMTVHRAQGSEFEHVMLILPQEASAVATKELLYTALTRAKRRFTLWASPSTLMATMQRRTLRMSGLTARLAEQWSAAISRKPE